MQLVADSLSTDENGDEIVTYAFSPVN